MLAATLTPTYGIYGPPFELLQGVPREAGSEEYLDSEKYQVRHWDLETSESIAPLHRRLNRIRREHPALPVRRASLVPALERRACTGLLASTPPTLRTSSSPWSTSIRRRPPQPRLTAARRVRPGRRRVRGVRAAERRGHRDRWRRPRDRARSRRGGRPCLPTAGAGPPRQEVPMTAPRRQRDGGRRARTAATRASSSDEPRQPRSTGFPPDPLWYKDAVIYEVPVRAFADSDGDGIGDFRGLTSRLDYLADLGVTAIWLLPFYPRPLRDDGYDIADYTRGPPRLRHAARRRDASSARPTSATCASSPSWSSTTPRTSTPGSSAPAARRPARPSATGTCGATRPSATATRASSSRTSSPPTGPGTRSPRPTTGTASTATSRT